MQMLDGRQQGEQGLAGGNDFNQPRFNAPQQGGNGYQNNNQGGGYNQNSGGGYGSNPAGFGNGGNSNPQSGGFAPKAPQQPASAPADLDDDLPF
jgi:single-strand DNA-binding protein